MRHTRRKGKQPYKRTRRYRGGSTSPTFHILLTASGRTSLKDMIDSLRPELGEGDAVSILFDGEEAYKNSGYNEQWKEGFRGKIIPIVEKVSVGNWGHALRTKHQGILEPRTTFVLHGDDDDVYHPGFMEGLRKKCTDPETLYIARMSFKHETYPNEVVPRHDNIEKGNISTHNGIIPSGIVGKGTWHPNYHGDYKYYEQLAKHAKNVQFLPDVIYHIQADVANKPKYLAYVFYHIYCNKYTLPVVKDQVTKIIFSGLYSAVREIKCFIAGEEKYMGPVNEFLSQSGAKFRVEKVGVNDASFERFTLNEIPKFITDDDVFLYLHTKGVSEKHAANDNIYWWRTWMEYNLIHRYQWCIELLKRQGYDIAGVGFTKKMIGPHYSGNFWWSKGSYFNTLPKNSDGTLNIGSGYLDPENFIFKGNTPKYIDVDEGRAPHPDTDYYSFKPGVRAANRTSHMKDKDNIQPSEEEMKKKKGGRRKTR